MLSRLPLSQNAPEHIAIIMDGNRRWAAQRGFPAIEGHRRGVAALRAAVRAAIDSGVRALTVYGFSTENWSRDRAEIAGLMHLCAFFARKERRDLLQQGVRVHVIGDIEAFPAATQRALADLVCATAHNSRLDLYLALNYSGRAEIVRAVRELAVQIASQEITPSEIDESALRAHFYAPHVPDPDLLIRTGGEFRISNFLLYQVAYTELLTLPIKWPDFTEQHFLDAVASYSDRQRRFGG